MTKFRNMSSVHVDFHMGETVEIVQAQRCGIVVGIRLDEVEAVRYRVRYMNDTGQILEHELLARDLSGEPKKGASWKDD